MLIPNKIYSIDRCYKWMIISLDAKSMRETFQILDFFAHNGTFALRCSYVLRPYKNIAIIFKLIIRIY
jgi:hypothetical protein